MSVKNQFYTGAACILFVFCMAASYIEYRTQQKQMYSSVKMQAETFLSTAAAIRAYAKDTLRPKMTELLPPDRFVIEAMSTSYISRETMKNLHDRFSKFSYKRSAADPRNPLNQSDAFENQVIDFFNTNPGEKHWSGTVQKGKKQYYARLMPIAVENECLNCHGKPSDAPVELLDRYGGEASFGYTVGEVIAADTIYIPMDVYRVQIKEKAFWVFTVGFSTLFSLLVLFYLLFNRTVVKKLQGLVVTFSGILGGGSPYQAPSKVSSRDEIEQLAGAFEDVADHLKVALENLKKSEIKYRRLFETSPNAIIIWDADNCITDMNEAGLTLFGFKNPDDACSKGSLASLFKEKEDARKIVDAVMKKGRIKDTEMVMVNSSGFLIDTIITANMLEDDSGDFAGFEAVVRDITEQKKINEHLAQTEKLASIGQLAAGVAHEINNPLGVISCYSTLIEKNSGGNEQISEDIGVIIKHTQSCKKVVESLLSFARASEPVMKETDIIACIEEVLSVLKHQMQKTNISVHCDFHDRPERMTVDPDKLSQVFLNLLMNAIHAMPRGGRISVRTYPGHDVLNIEIEDTGSGIGDEDIGRIFEPFFTTKEAGAGTGLGLSVSYGIVRRHGGELSVRSESEKGTVFTVVLPRSHGGH